MTALTTTGTETIVASECPRCSLRVRDIHRCRKYRLLLLKFWSLDMVFGATLGFTVGIAHALLITANLKLFWTVLISMAIMMTLELAFALLIGGIVGSVEAMVTGMFIALGAMIAALIPTSQMTSKVLAGASVGFVIGLLFVCIDARSRGQSRVHSRPLAPRRVSPPPSFTFPIPPWLYDLLEGAGARRRACPQRGLFAAMGEQVLFVAAGSGLNFAYFPANRRIVAIDVNSNMLRRASDRARSYDGTLKVMEADVLRLPFANASFDTVATASTFCSVPDPRRGPSELYRVLEPGGTLVMFEHVRSRKRLIAWNQDMMNIGMRFLGSNVNRDTVSAVREAGFIVDHIGSAYLDVFLAIEGHKPITKTVNPLPPFSSQQKGT